MVAKSRWPSLLARRLSADPITSRGVWVERAAARSDAGLTVRRLTRAAGARVPKPQRLAACLHVSRAVRAACRRPNTAERAGSAGGPKPGRAGFYLELGRVCRRGPRFSEMLKGCLQEHIKFCELKTFVLNNQRAKEEQMSVLK